MLEQALADATHATRHNNEWRTHCPIHGDETPSLDFREKGGALVFTCRSKGCDSGAILAAFRERFPAIFKPTRQRDPHGGVSWQIKDAEGRTVAIHHRGEFLTEAGDKTIWWTRPDGSKGLGGMPTADLPLYGSELLKDVPKGELVVLCEGERATDAARRLGFHAVGTVCGASVQPSGKALAVLTDRDVVLWPDNDEPGFKHMRGIKHSLMSLYHGNRQGLTDSVCWLVPDAPPKADAADFKGTKADALACLKDEPKKEDTPTKPRARSISGPALRTAKFPELPAILTKLHTPVLRLKKMLQVVGYRGLGKSWLMQTWALLVQAGSGYDAMGFTAPASRRTLYIDGEMSAQDIQARFVLLSDALKIPLTENLRILAADWQDEPLPRLDTAEGQEFVAEDVAWCEAAFLDNRSCLFDPNGEKEPDIWQAAQDWILRLRREGKAVAWAHHANRQGTTRGISKPEDVIDLELTLKRPGDYAPEQGARFVAEWTKIRASYGPGFASFDAGLTDGVWTVQSAAEAEAGATAAKVLDFVRTKQDVGERVPSSNAVAAGIGGRKTEVLAAVRELLRDGKLVKDGKTLRVPA